MNLRCRGTGYAPMLARVLLIPRCNHLLACPPVSCGGSASTNESVFILQVPVGHAPANQTRMSKRYGQAVK